MTALKKSIEEVSKLVQRLVAKVKVRRKRKAEMKIDMDNMESIEGPAATNHKIAQETGTNEGVVSVKEDAKEHKEEQFAPGVAECVEQTLVRPVHTLGIIDNVYPTARYHVGKLAWVSWSILHQLLPTIDEENSL